MADIASAPPAQLQRRTASDVQAKRAFEPVTADTRAIAAGIIADVKERGEVLAVRCAHQSGDVATTL